jgi:hypothetical protein
VLPGTHGAVGVGESCGGRRLGAALGRPQPWRAPALTLASSRARTRERSGIGWRGSTFRSWVVAAFLFAVLRNRRRRDPPSQPSEAPRLELALGVLLLSIASALDMFTLASEGRFAEPEAVATAAARAVSPTRDGLRIDVTGARWRWRFDYPELGITTPMEHDDSRTRNDGRLTEFTATAPVPACQTRS